MHHLPRVTLTAALFSSLLIGPLAHADIVNGSFAAGLTGWQTFGDVAALNASPSGLALPLSGSTLVLSSATLGSDDYPFADGHYNVSGQDAGMAGVPGGLEDFVGATPGSLDPDPINHTSFLWEGSAAKQTFTVQAGDTLHFDWNLLSADRDFADSAFAVIQQSGNGLLVLSLADALAATQNVAGNADLLQTGTHQFSHTFAQAGTVTLSLAVADLQAGDKTTLLAVNNVQLAAAVPEPTSGVLALLALGAFGVGMQRRKRQG
jgi:hypothetical protein